jgi:hypothetical protein
MLSRNPSINTIRYFESLIYKRALPSGLRSSNVLIVLWVPIWPDCATAGEILGKIPEVTFHKSPP